MTYGSPEVPEPGRSLALRSVSRTIGEISTATVAVSVLFVQSVTPYVNVSRPVAPGSGT
jgi:hypothetical protein